MLWLLQGSAVFDFVGSLQHHTITTHCGHFDQKCFLWLATFGQKMKIDSIAQLKIVKHH